MVTIVKKSLSLPKTLLDQAEILAQHLNISQNQLVALAIEDFIKKHANQTLFDEMNESDLDLSDADEPARLAEESAASIDDEQLVIHQGDIYWILLDDLSGAELNVPHPYVVIQDDLFNQSRINTAVVCALTSNMKRANTPGNVLLDVGEANLPKQSVVEVSKVSTVGKTQLGGYIGSLSEERIKQILAGMRFLQRSFFSR